MLSKQVFIACKECYEKGGLLVTWAVIAWARMLRKPFGSIHRLLRKSVFVVVPPFMVEYSTIITQESNSLVVPNFNTTLFLIYSNENWNLKVKI